MKFDLNFTEYIVYHRELALTHNISWSGFSSFCNYHNHLLKIVC